MIRTIRLENFMPFRGSHRIDLEAKAYAVVARFEKDQSRSNSAGKSSLAEAIDFALFGRTNPARRFDADGWITRGEKEGSVSITFADGTELSRTRLRGKPTQVRFTVPGGGTASQADAETEILKWLALGEDEFRATCYFEQRQTARLVLARPEERLGIVTGWLGISKLEDAADRAGEIASVHATRSDGALQRIAALRNVGSPPGDNAENLGKVLEEAEAEHAEAKTILGRLEVELGRARGRERAQRTLEEFQAVVGRGKALRAEVDAAPDPTAYEEQASELAAMEGRAAIARRDVQAKRKVALGQFDGACPVAPIECPAKKAINAGREGAQKALESAQALSEEADTRAHEARQQASQGLAEKAKLDRLQGELAQLRDRLEGLKERAREAKRTLEENTREEYELLPEHTEAQEVAARLGERVQFIKAGIRQRAELAKEIEASELAEREEGEKAETASAARRVLRLAHRRIAERNLDEIGQAANEALAHAGIDLTIDVRWDREGKGLAKQCAQCGLAFPASLKVKACTRCNAEREQHTVSRLEFLPSRRSGGMDDFAGTAMQLSAAEWLLSRRQSPWGMLMIDEPFGQLDAHARRALAKHLATTLARGHAVRQAIVIAHDAAVLDSFGGRIQVVAGERGSKVTVVA